MEPQSSVEESFDELFGRRPSVTELFGRRPSVSEDRVGKKDINFNIKNKASSLQMQARLRCTLAQDLASLACRLRQHNSTVEEDVLGLVKNVFANRAVSTLLDKMISCLSELEGDEQVTLANEVNFWIKHIMKNCGNVARDARGFHVILSLITVLARIKTQRIDQGIDQLVPAAAQLINKLVEQADKLVGHPNARWVVSVLLSHCEAFDIKERLVSKCEQGKSQPKKNSDSKKTTGRGITSDASQGFQDNTKATDECSELANKLVDQLLRQAVKDMDAEVEVSEDWPLEKWSEWGQTLGNHRLSWSEIDIEGDF